MNRKRGPLTPNLQAAKIEKLSHDGRGIARINGKTTFIQGALPGEQVRFQYTRSKRDFDEGSLVELIEPSALRVEPRCPHYTLCGGCSLQHLDAKAQLIEKEALLIDILQRIGHCKPDWILPPLNSHPWHYRNKARFSVRYVEKKGSTLIGFREKNNPRFITEINQCPIMHAQVDAQLVNLRQLVNGLDDPKSIAQLEVAIGDDQVALIFRNLLPLTANDKTSLCHFGKQSGFHIWLQPNKPDQLQRLYPESANEYLSYSLTKEGIVFQFYPTDFTQINPNLNQLMVRAALDLLDLTSTDVVLDLFCGMGNFSLPMAKYCAKVIGVEGCETMVSRAQNNAKMNKLFNVDFFCANLDEVDNFSTKFAYNFNKILLDPPRAGALELVKQMDKLKPQRLVYVSCNPATLARDADILVNQKGYRLQVAGVMDMFPHTTHVESIALFERE